MQLNDHILGLLDAEKPYIEIINGRGREKNVSPEWPHSRAQGEFWRIFTDYSTSHGGDVGVELRFVIVGPLGTNQSILPDVSYYTDEQKELGGEEERRYPRRSPYAAVEIRSSDDRPGEREEKIELYVALGSRLVLDMDPRRETLTAIDAETRRTFTKDDVFEHPALPGLRVELGPLFARINR